jgi:hypothetical protein
VAFHAYRSDDRSHLTFPSGACIIARPGQEGNALWFGSYEQRRGWFPPSYCRIVLVPPRRLSTTPRPAYDDRRRTSMKNDRTPSSSSSPAGMEVTTRSRSLLDQKSGRPSNRDYWQERPDSIDSSWRSRSLDNDESDHNDNASRNEPPRDDEDDDHRVHRVLPPVSGNTSIGTPQARSGQSIFAKVDRFVEELLIRSDHLPLLPEPADESSETLTTAPPAKLCHRFQDNVERNVPITACSGGDVVDSSSIIRNSPKQQQQSSDNNRCTRNDNIKSKVTADHHRPSTLTCPNHTMTNPSTTTSSSPWSTTTPSPKVWNKGHRRATSEIIVTSSTQHRENSIHPPVFIIQKTEMEEENDDPIDPIEVLAAEFRRRQLRARLRRVQPISAS